MLGSRSSKVLPLLHSTKKIQDLKAGNTREGEIDEITAPNFHITPQDNIN